MVATWAEGWPWWRPGQRAGHGGDIVYGTPRSFLDGLATVATWAEGWPWWRPDRGSLAMVATWAEGWPWWRPGPRAGHGGDLG
jgi:hypothetical protein